MFLLSLPFTLFFLHIHRPFRTLFQPSSYSYSVYITWGSLAVAPLCLTSSEPQILFL